LDPKVLENTDYIFLEADQFSTLICPDGKPFKFSAQKIREKFLHRYPNLTLVIKSKTQGSRLVSDKHDIFMPNLSKLSPKLAEEMP